MSSITPEQLIIAVRRGSVATIREWWQSEPGIHVDMIMVPDESPLLHIACGRGNLDVMKYLVQTCHATVDIKNNDGNTTLIYAIKMRNMDAIKCLVESCGADVNAKDSMGYTPLHCAATHRQLHIVKYLVELGKADITVCNNDNQTPLQVAKLTDSNPCTEYLSSCSQEADPNHAKTDDATAEMLKLGHHSIGQQKLHALQNSSMADLTFLVGRDIQQEAIKAYSGILLITVPSTKAMIDRSTNEGTILLPDFYPAHVRYTLQYIYSGETSCLDADDMARPEDLQQLLIVATHFHCWQLKVIVEAKLVDKHLSPDTLIELLLFADEHKCRILKEMAIQMAAKDANALIGNPHFDQLAGCADLMKGIHVAHNAKDNKASSDDADCDKYENMSLVELYGCLDECKGVHLESDMDRPALLEVVRTAMFERESEPAAWW
eukprot:CAMPEP_0198117218 /NCGR_PEP_ID=MMETSP1442-20131203/17188_1 /TAXON_ID= /ORGANISM="Craspedostauros australis, Strain CCMP3328" /LENGTH=434 /DNA_ID=CAMNT_0043775223 /DNA_START=5 /DNA_END=1306 /DNA_ORIENTATION=+